MAIEFKRQSQVYLAGGFYKNYKDIVYGALGHGFLLLDPENRTCKPMPGEYVGADLRDIENADVLLAYQDVYPYVYGMAAEMGYAVAVGKPVIYVCTAKRVDSFLSGLARATFTDLAAACQFIRERYAGN